MTARMIGTIASAGFKVETAKGLEVKKTTKANWTLTTARIDSLSHFLSEVFKQSKLWRSSWEKEQAAVDEFATSWLPWFRGEDNATWCSGFGLQPKPYRNQTRIEMILDHEQDMRIEFRRRAAQLITERLPADKWEWYFLMQHYRAPTRLLDWSDSALVALHFAVCHRGGNEDKYSGVDASVYMLDPWWLNKTAFKEVSPVANTYQSLGPAMPDWEEAQPYLPEEFDSKELGLSCPLAIDPSHFSRRIAAQKSRFTIFGRDKDGLKSLAKRSTDCRLLKYDISQKEIPQIKRDLRIAGISEETIFPDLEGLGRELAYFFEDNCREQ